MILLHTHKQFVLTNNILCISMPLWHHFSTKFLVVEKMIIKQKLYERFGNHVLLRVCLRLFSLLVHLLHYNVTCGGGVCWPYAHVYPYPLDQELQMVYVYMSNTRVKGWLQN